MGIRVGGQGCGTLRETHSGRNLLGTPICGRCSVFLICRPIDAGAENLFQGSTAVRVVPVSE